MTRSIVFGCRGTFCVKRGSKYDPVGPIDAFVASVEVEGTKSWIVVRCGTDLEFEGEVTTAMVVQFHIQTGSVFWSAFVEDELEQLAFKFAVDPATKLTPQHATQTFVEKYNRCLYTTLTGVVVPTEDNDEVNYIAAAGTTQIDREAKDEAVFGMDAAPVFTNTGKGVNTCFAESVQFNRALVFQTRGGKSVAQAHVVGTEGFAGDVQEFEVDAQGIQGALLQAGDQKMFYLDSKSAKLDGELRELDLATGSIIQTYEPAADAGGIKSVRYLNKFAAESPNLLSCISSNAAFVIDTRLDPKKCAVVDDGKDFSDYQYRSLKKDKFFTCHATSRNGFLAVGDESGSVRLYTGPPGARKAEGGGHHAKLAKTLIELATPVLHIDVTNDGEFVIVTTKDRVLVLCTLYIDDKKKEKNGFEGRMGKQKPSPLALLPSPAQVLRMGGASAVNFAKATLEGVDGSEQWIVAVCGSMICTWSMARVREAVKSHSVVYCETKDAECGTLLGAEIRNDRVEFLSSAALGIQLRSKETKKKTGGFTFYSD
jgi:hypothetical protein